MTISRTLRRASTLVGLFVSLGSTACSSTQTAKEGARGTIDAGSDGTPSSPGDSGVVSHVALPSASPGIGFDDLQFSPTLGKVLAPGGRSGNLDLVDVLTEEITAISGFSASTDYAGGHDYGTTSAVEGPNGFLFATDRTTDQIHVVDPSSKTIVSSAALAAHPDYVRWVESASEVWLTEPDKGQIEILTASKSQPPTLTAAATIAVAGGPESLVIDGKRGRAYTNSFVGSTYAVDVAGRAVVETWSNGCTLSLGLALDEARGYAFVGCPAGKAVVLDVANGGATLGTADTGAGVDIVAYGETTGHLYVPSPNDKTLTILGVSKSGTLTTLGIVEGSGSGVVADDRRQAWVTDPPNGALIRVRDDYAATK